MRIAQQQLEQPGMPRNNHAVAVAVAVAIQL